MSLLQRINRGQKSNEILEKLLGRLYDTEEELKQVIERLVNETEILTEANKKVLDATPTHFLITFRPQAPTPPIRVLLERLEAESTLSSSVNAIIQDENIKLTDAEQAFMETNCIDFLMGVQPPSPQPKLTIDPSQLTDRNALGAILQYIINDDKLINLATHDRQAFRNVAEELFIRYLEDHDISLQPTERQHYFNELIAELVGYGPLETLIYDDSITEIRVLGLKNISIKKDRKWEQTHLEFDDSDHIWRIIDRMVAPLGKRLDESTPIGNFRLLDGSRMSVIHHSIANNGPILTITKRDHRPIIVADLIRFGTVTEPAMKVLQACVQAGCNILITGLHDAGRTTLLNAVSSFIPYDELIVTIEDASELLLLQETIVLLHTRPPNVANEGEITKQHLLRHSGALNPDRIVLSEVSGEEVYNLMVTPVPWMTTFLSREPEEAIPKLEPLYLMGDEKRPLKAVRSRISDRVDIIVHIDRLRSGDRRVTRISEVYYDNNEQLVVHDLFRFEDTSGLEQPRLQGMLRIVNQPTNKLRHRLGDEVNTLFNDEASLY